MGEKKDEFTSGRIGLGVIMAFYLCFCLVLSVLAFFLSKRRRRRILYVRTMVECVSSAVVFYLRICWGLTTTAGYLEQIYSSHTLRMIDYIALCSKPVSTVCLYTCLPCRYDMLRGQQAWLATGVSDITNSHDHHATMILKGFALNENCRIISTLLLSK